MTIRYLGFGFENRQTVTKQVTGVEERVEAAGRGVGIVVHDAQASSGLKWQSGSRITIRTVFGFDEVLLLERVRNACRKTDWTG